jgi:hypothetical protein
MSADMVSAQAILLKSVSIAARAVGDPARLLGAIRAATEDLDARLLAGDWRTLTRNASWLLDYMRRQR